MNISVKFNPFKIIAILITLLSFSCQDAQLKNKIIEIGEKQNIDTIRTLRVAVGAMVTPKSTYEHYNELIAYLAQKIGYRYRFIQRRTYKQVNDLIQNNEVDIAFICSGAYKIASQTFNPPIICVPVMYGEPYYQSILIAPKNSTYNSIDSLQGATVCYTDSLSNSGYMYLKHYFKSKNIITDSLFRKQLFSGGHDISIGMVQKNLVDVAPVDKLIFDYLMTESPQLVSNIKIIHYSPKFGIPPIVASHSLDRSLLDNIYNVLSNMHNDDVGKKILKKMHIDKFVVGNKKDYENVPLYLE